MLDSKIFIQIASYRDKELSKTINSAIKNAKFPENLTFGIVNQFDEKTNHDIDVKNIRMISIPWQNSEGVGEVRYLCGAMWDGEDFSLQVDSRIQGLRKIGTNN